MSLSPSIELRTLFGSAGADTPGTLNSSGVADPVVDALIEEVIASDTRDEMDVRVRALDRVLRAEADLGAELVPRPRTWSPTGTSSAAPRRRRPTPAATPPGGSTRRSTTS